MGQQQWPGLAGGAAWRNARLPWRMKRARGSVRIGAVTQECACRCDGSEAKPKHSNAGSGRRTCTQRERERLTLRAWHWNTKGGNTHPREAARTSRPPSVEWHRLYAKHYTIRQSYTRMLPQKLQQAHRAQSSQPHERSLHRGKHHASGGNQVFEPVDGDLAMDAHVF